jgi:polysaccharide export outer membrane protein
VGEIVAAGLTPNKLQARITEGLSGLLNNPQVTVQVQAVRSKRYYVTGEVFRPGAYPLVVPTTVFEAVTLAGGFREFANKKNITIVRGEKRIKFNYNDVVKGKHLEQNIPLENGDHIIVP